MLLLVNKIFRAKYLKDREMKKVVLAKQPTMLVSLDDIWSKKSDAINKVLKKSETSFLEVLPNKIKIAQIYAKTKQLIPEDRVTVNHPQFVSVALALGRLEDIKTKIMLLLTLEPLFNERNLLALLSDYNPVKKLYLFVRTLNQANLLTYNAENFNIEKSGNPNLNDCYAPFYHKGFLYVCHDDNYLLAVDLASDETFAFPQTKGCYMLRALIISTNQSPLLYYLDEKIGFLSFNLDTLEVVPSNIDFEHEESIDGDFIYTFKDNFISQYDGKTSPPTLLSKRFFHIETDSFVFQVIDHKIFFNHSDVYDFDSFNLLGTIEIPRGSRIYSILSHDNKIYVPFENHGIFNVKIYSGVTLEYLGLLVDNLNFGGEYRLKGVDIRENKLTVLYLTASRGGVTDRINALIFNLDDGTYHYITVNSSPGSSFMIIG
jgi:hypothetical protein